MSETGFSALDPVDEPVHVCLLWRSPTELAEALELFMAPGLREGEECLLCAPEGLVADPAHLTRFAGRRALAAHLAKRTEPRALRIGQVLNEGQDCAEAIAAPRGAAEEVSPAMRLCAYELAGLEASTLLDLVDRHDVTLVRGPQGWKPLRGGSLNASDERQQMRAWLSTVPDLVALVDGNHRVRFLNQAAASALGRDAEALHGRLLRELVTDPRLADDLDGLVDKALAENRMIQRELATGTGGEKRYFECRAIPDGARRTVVLAVRERTGTRQARQALARLVRLQQNQLDSIPVPVFFKDRAGRYTGCNRAFASFVGRPPDEIVGRETAEIWGPDAALVHRAMDAKALETTENVVYPQRMARGEEMRAMVIYKGLLNRSRDVVGIVGTMLDVTEEHHAKEALAHQTEMLLLTLSSLSDAVISTASDGTVALINPAAELLTGWRSDEATGQPLLRLVSFLDPDSSEELRDLGRLAAPADSPRRLLVLRDRNGVRRLVAVRTTSIGQWFEGSVDLVLVLQDVSEQYRHEERTKLSQKMESIGQLAAGIAHEINTPMQYVSDNVQFLDDAFRTVCGLLLDLSALGKAESLVAEDLVHLRSLARQDLESLVEEISSAVRETLEGIDRVTKIVLALKDFTHPESSEKALADINHAVEVTATISRNVWKYVAELTFEPDQSLPLVLCNADEINQVILNLIVNAADAIGERRARGEGALGHIRLRTESGTDSVRIIVSDDGAGIPEAVRHRIFDLFFTTKEVGKGSGQGLAIAHDIIVNKHRGRIDVESRVNEGTTFVLTLPVEPTATEGLA